MEVVVPPVVEGAANRKAAVWGMESVRQAASVMLDEPNLELVAIILAGDQATRVDSGLMGLVVVGCGELAGLDAACCSIPAVESDAVAAVTAVAAVAAVAVASRRAAAIFS